jgi:large subunit ribosomal protein L30
MKKKMTKKTKSKQEKKTGNKIVVIRVRGKIHLTHELNKTFEMLNLYNKNGCVIIENTPSMMGMVKKVKDYVTWGEIKEENYKTLIEKKADLYKGRTEDSKSKIKYNKYFTHNKKKYKKFIRLSPPEKGFGRKGVKISFSKGGAIGYRGEKINDLLKRMI